MRICNESHLEGEKIHLLNLFCRNGYSRSQGLQDSLKAAKGPLSKKNKDPSQWSRSVRLPFIQGTTDKIARVLRKHEVSSSFKPLNTIHSSSKQLKTRLTLGMGKVSTSFLVPVGCLTLVKLVDL